MAITKHAEARSRLTGFVRKSTYSDYVVFHNNNARMRQMLVPLSDLPPKEKELVMEDVERPEPKYLLTAAIGEW